MNSIFTQLHKHSSVHSSDFTWHPYEFPLPIPAQSILYKGSLSISGADSGDATPRSYTCYLLSSEIIRVAFSLHFSNSPV